jgi:hypothetical protein
MLAVRDSAAKGDRLVPYRAPRHLRADFESRVSQKGEASLSADRLVSEDPSLFYGVLWCGAAWQQ